jgi:hypothetical protein
MVMITLLIKNFILRFLKAIDFPVTRYFTLYKSTKIFWEVEGDATCRLSQPGTLTLAPTEKLLWFYLIKVNSNFAGKNLQPRNYKEVKGN